MTMLEDNSILMGRRPLKTLPWEKMSTALRKATKAWVESGGDPALFTKVAKLQKTAQRAARAETGPRRR